MANNNLFNQALLKCHLTWILCYVRFDTEILISMYTWLRALSSSTLYQAPYYYQWSVYHAALVKSIFCRNTMVFFLLKSRVLYFLEHYLYEQKTTKILTRIVCTVFSWTVYVWNQILHLRELSVTSDWGLGYHDRACQLCMKNDFSSCAECGYRGR